MPVRRFVLAADDLDAHRLLLEQLQTAAPETSVLIGTVQSVSFLTPLPTLVHLAADLRDLVDKLRPRANSPATEKLRIRARRKAGWPNRMPALAAGSSSKW
jgi:hypothetical protein